MIVFTEDMSLFRRILFKFFCLFVLFYVYMYVCICVWFFCMYVCVHPCSICGDQMRLLDPLELDLQVVVSCQ